MRKKLCLFVVLAILVFIAPNCDNGMSPKDNDNELRIYAKVENAPEYSDVVEVKLVTVTSGVVARGEWKGDGFTIVLPKTLGLNHLHTLINNKASTITIINTPSTLTMSNKNVNVVTANFVGVDKDGNEVTYFFPFEIDKDGNARGAFYTYVDSDVTISGYTEREGIVYTEYDEELFRGMILMRIWWPKITTTYSVNWKVGWNIWELSRIYPAGGIGTVTEEWSSTPFNELKWYGGKDLRNLPHL